VKALLANPALLAAVGGGIVLLLVLLLVLRGRRRRSSGRADEIPGLEAALARGNYLQAGFLAAKHERYEEAIDYYLRAQEPLRAAQIAARTRNVRRAAELYERGKDLERAAHFYEQCGMLEKAAELRRAAHTAAHRAAADTPRPAGAPDGDPFAGVAEGRPTSDRPAAARDEAELRFREAKAAAKDDPAAQARLQELGTEAAESLLRVGNIRGAAAVYRDAGLFDEAIHLYVNVLGTPGEAAPLLAAQGKHERAAELYELAGQVERAAATWADVARGSQAPERYVERIERLSADVAFRLLDELTNARPLSEQTAELHYRLASALQQRGEAQRALQVFGTLQQQFGEFLDVGQRIAGLRAPATPAAAAPRATQAGRPGSAPSRYRMGAADGPLPPPPDLGHAQTGLSAPPAPPAGGDVGLSVEQISAIARQVAEAAMEQARRGLISQALVQAPAAGSRVRTRAPAEIVVVGLERQAVPVESLIDAAAAIARSGPSIDTLNAFIGNRPCDLGNIEVFYRLGLAQLADGRWAEALRAFDAVEEASPGYRDAGKRADHIRSWQDAVGPRMTLAAPAGTAGAAGPTRFRVLGELGRGGMAVVYRAYDEVLGRDVALKFLAEELTVHKEAREMFQREARSAAQLNHPNIVTIYDYGVLEGKAYIAMEYLDGVSVQQLIEQRGRLSVVEALRIGRQVLDALEYAHDRSIVHRDIKPSNMMQTKTGLVKLMDFGLAKSVASGAKASIVAGTPPYMPGEQLTGGDVDHRADLFAVGCSLYEMLTGSLPFEGFDRTTPPASVTTFDANLPPMLDGILRRALATAPADRQQSAAELNVPIRRILEAVDSFSAAAAGPAATARTEFAAS
jgi:tetratricopeptide (TPR) repeat protein